MQFEHGHALIIGVGEYIYHATANIDMAAEDARQVQAVLCDRKLCGYPPDQVNLLVGQQASRAAVLQGFRDLGAKTTPEDTVLIFFSGHGALGSDGSYYLTCCDTHFAEGRVVKGSGISEGELLTLLRAIPAQKMILLINACYAGELSPHFALNEPQEVESTGLPHSTADAILSSGKGRIIITSSQEEQRSWGKAGGKNSFFAQALIDGLRGKGWVRNNAGYVGAFGLYEYLYAAVKEAAADIGQAQDPELTALKTAGPFPLALYKGASQLGSFDVQEALSEEVSVRRVTEKTSQRHYERIIKMGGGAYIEGNVIVEKGDFVNGDKTEYHYHAPDPAEAATKQQDAARKAYLKELRSTCQALPLAALGEDEGTGADVTLDQIYIDLDTTTRVKIEKKEQKKAKKQPELLPPFGEDDRPVTALEAVASNSRLVLLGDPGAGKSTFVRRLAAWLAAAGLGEAIPPIGIEPSLMPILVTLRELAPRLNSPEYETLSTSRRQTILLEALHEQIRAELALLGKQALAYADDLLADLAGGHCLLVLDGLDEVPYDLRQRVREAVAAMIQRYQVDRMIITCRIRSYSGTAVFAGFDVFTLAPFDEEKIRRFSTAWYNTQRTLKKIAGEEQAQKRAESLSSAALSLQELASNPMLLTSMAIIHQRDIGLPEQRVRLYSLVVDVLIRRWQKHKSGELLPSKALEAFFRDDLRLRATLERLGYEAHRASASQADGEQTGDLLRIRALEILENREYLGDPGLANEFLDYVDQRSGLLAGRGGELGRPAAYGFPHRSLQEYLAGCFLMGQRDLFGTLFKHAGEGEGWDLAVQLGFEELYYNRRGANQLLDLAYHICASCDAADLQKQRSLLWSGQAATLVGVQIILQDNGRPDGGQRYLQHIRGRLIEVMGGQLPPIERAEAGNALARLGDHRQEVMTVEAMQFALIAPGPFRMGDGKETHNVDLPAFWLAQYPVTNAQFDAFVEDGGYAKEQYWPEAKQAGYWKNGLFKGALDPEGHAGRLQMRDPFNLPNHPVVVVTWYEALAFTGWLNDLAHQRGWLDMAWKISLPSEAEWEKAARGGIRIPEEMGRCFCFPLNGLAPVVPEVTWVDNPLAGRAFPWQGEFDPEKANTAESGIGATSAAGCFPGGASPYGLQDMSGNVWEWTRSAGKDYPYDSKDGRENLTGDVDRVLRGGSWYDYARLARCSCRSGDDPSNRSNNLGFRVAVLPSSTLNSERQ